MKNILYYGLSSTDFNKCSSQISDSKKTLNQTLSGISYLCITALWIVAQFFEQLQNFRIVYGIFSCVFLTLFLISKYKSSLHPTILMYTVCCCLCLFGMMLAFSYPTEKLTIIHLAFVVLPLVFIDTPIHALIYTCCMAIAYKLLGSQFQPEHLRFAELFNTIVLFFVANIMHWIINKGRCEGYLARVTRDEAIETLKQAQSELMHISVTDSLTRLNNRRKLFETLSAIQLCQVPRPIAVFMIDIDYFKEVNDRYGHGAGDRYLEQIGKELSELGIADCFTAYRYGGEEFAAFMHGGSSQSAAQTAEAIRLAASAIDIGQAEPVTVSIGYVICDNPKIDNYEKWIDCADEAVYEAKHQGRNRAVCWNDMNHTAKGDHSK